MNISDDTLPHSTCKYILSHAYLSRAPSHLSATPHPSAYQHAIFRPSHTYMHDNSHSTCTQCTMR